MEEQEFIGRLLETFKVEAAEHVSAMSAGLEMLGSRPDQETVEVLYREAHSLKGAARAVGMNEVEISCQQLEDLLAEMKKGAPVTPELLDRLHEAIDEVSSLLPQEQALAEPSESSIETVRVDLRKLRTVLRQAEELLSPKLAEQQHLKELDEILDMFAKGKGRRSEILRMSRSMEDRMRSLVDSELLAVRNTEARLAAFRKSAGKQFHAFSAMIDDLLGDTREMLMMPFSSISDAFPRLVRDLSKELGKKIALDIKGGEIEIDRRVLEEIKDPLIHLLRNAADHGIESPDARSALGKQQEGRIAITLAQKDGGKVEIAVSDDGSGIDDDRVVEAALQLGFSPEAEGGAVPLLFKSGISTSAEVTGISGRGLGLAIVHEKVEKLGGEIAIETAQNRGTIFRLGLPLTLSTFRGVLVKAAGKPFIIPSSSIEHVLRVDAQDIRPIGNMDSVEFDGRAVALAGLSEVLEMGTQKLSDGKMIIIVLGRGGAQTGFKVDEILDEQEVLVKNLGPQLVRVRNVSGACLLGTGETVPVLNPADLLKSVMRRPQHRIERQEKPREKRVLVVEDSITSRILLKGILESAGYLVNTAVDGLDAMKLLKKEAFDLVVSDIEMPRMNGFTLTSEIRADKKLAALPVVLVTSLESREHREQGIEAGADAYIVKSSFDQSDLIEAAGRLT